MSNNYAPPPYKPDGRIFASYPMPAKIDLLQERPRRESLVELELQNEIGKQFVAPVPKIEVTEQTYASTVTNQNNNNQHIGGHSPISYSTNDQQNITYRVHSSSYSQPPQGNSQTVSDNQMVYQQQLPQTNQLPPQYQYQDGQQSQTVTTVTSTNSTNTAATKKTKNILNDCIKNNAANLAAELAEKEAKLMAEINALHQRPYSPFATPGKIDLTTEGRKLQQQQEHAPSPRPQSRATSADFLDKEAKLLQEIDEIDRKPFNPQTMVVEREQWFEYPQGRPNDRHLTDSKRRIRDFCSLPSHMYQDKDRHIHEENLPHLLSSTGRPSPTSPSSIHTTIIRSPKREIDNKSPLPFAFDNFTTKGVRGNIASVGAIEPDRPRAPIYPIVKRSPSPNLAR